MNILVSNLSEHVVANDLLQLFAVYGEVSFVVISRDKMHGRSLGIAFVAMPNEANGNQAVRGLDRQLLDGHVMAVQEIEYRAGEFAN